MAQDNNFTKPLCVDIASTTRTSSDHALSYSKDICYRFTDKKMLIINDETIDVQINHGKFAPAYQRIEQIFVQKTIQATTSGTTIIAFSSSYDLPQEIEEHFQSLTQDVDDTKHFCEILVARDITTLEQFLSYIDDAEVQSEIKHDAVITELLTNYLVSKSKASKQNKTIQEIMQQNNFAITSKNSPSRWPKLAKLSSNKYLDATKLSVVAPINSNVLAQLLGANCLHVITLCYPWQYEAWQIGIMTYVCQQLTSSQDIREDNSRLYVNVASQPLILITNNTTLTSDINRIQLSQVALYADLGWKLLASLEKYQDVIL